MGITGKKQLNKSNSDHLWGRFSESFAGKYLAYSNSANAVTCVPPEGFARLFSCAGLMITRAAALAAAEVKGQGAIRKISNLKSNNHYIFKQSEQALPTLFAISSYQREAAKEAKGVRFAGSFTRASVSNFGTAHPAAITQMCTTRREDHAII